MVVCSRSSVSVPAAYESAAVRRMAAAFCVSALVHMFFAISVTPGLPGHSVKAAAIRTITARLESPAPPEPIVPPAVVDVPSDTVRPHPRKERARVPPAETAQVAPAEPKAAGSAGAAPDSTYYAARQLDVYPALTTPLDLRYSSNAAAAGLQGRALLLLLIDANGRVDDVSVVEAEPAGYFEEDARRAFRDARFTPARKDGRAVKSRVLVRVNYGSESAAQ